MILAIADGALDPADLVSDARRRHRRGRPADRSPLVFKSVGMSWQDLVVARAIWDGRADVALQ